MAAVLTTCPQCNRKARVVNGLCSSCGVLRGPTNSPALEPRYSRGSSFGSDLETVALYGVWLVPTFAAIVIGLLLSLEALLIIGVAALIVPPVVRLLFDGRW